MSRVGLVLTLFFLFFSNAISQDEFIKFTNISTEEGLPVSVVFDFAEDLDGFMWIGTQDGLVKYDGINFKIYRTSYNKSSILTNNITKIYKSNDQKLWLSYGVGEKGITLFDPKKETYEHFLEDTLENKLHDSNVREFIYDKNDNLWMGTVNNGLFLFDKKNKSFKQYLENITIWDLFNDSEGNFWVGTSRSKGLYKYDFENDQFKNYSPTTVDDKNNPKDEYGLIGTFILGITEDNQNNLILSTWGVRGVTFSKFNTRTEKFYNIKNQPKYFKKFPNATPSGNFVKYNNQIWFSSVSNNFQDGLFRYDLEDETIHQYKHNDVLKNTLTNDKAQSIYIDKTGLIWIGTFGGGFSKLRFAKNQHFTNIIKNPTDTNSLISSDAMGVLRDSKNRVWYGSFDSQGLTSFNLNTRIYKRYFPNRHIPFNQISNIFEDRRENIWFATDNGIYLYNDKTDNFKQFNHIPSKDASSRPNQSVNNIFEDNSGVLWIGHAWGFSEFDYKTNTYKDFISEQDKNTNSPLGGIISIDEYDNKLLLGSGRGFSIYDKENKSYKHFVHSPTDSLSLSDNSAQSILVSKERIIWVGTQNGLNKFIPESETFQRFTTEDGLTNNVIYGILEDDAGNLWMSSNVGIMCFNPKTYEVKSYVTQDGIQGKEFNSASFYKDKTGKMYFGGTHGFTEFYPDKVLKNLTKPSVALNNIQINYKDLVTDSIHNSLTSLDLNYTQNTLSFDIAGLEFTIPEKNQYKYQMENLDPEWIEAGSRREIIYTNIPYGKYILKIKASNHDGIWSEERKIPITIHPPLWLEPWAIAVESVLAIFLIISIPLLKIRRDKKQRVILETMVDERTSELKSANEEMIKLNDNLEEENTVRRRTELALLKANKESEAILKNVKEGLFLLNSTCDISEQHSDELEFIFESTDLGKQNLVNLMEPLLTKKNVEALKDFVELLFNSDIDEEVVNELNPLDQVEVHFEHETGKFDTKYLVFSFRRISGDDEIFNLLVTVRDETETVELQQQLEDSQRKNKVEMEQMLSILRIEPHMLNEFLDHSENLLIQISNRFKAGEETDFRTLASEIFRDIHNLKGNAGLLDLKLFIQKFHKAEEILSDVKSQDDITGDDFLKVLFEINEVLTDIRSMRELIDRVVKMSTSLREGGKKPSTTQTAEVLLQSLENTIKRIGTEVGKNAKLVTEGLSESAIPDKYKIPFKDIVIQLIRNSLIHGIETEDERRTNNKLPEGQLKISIQENENGFSFKYRDDGQGLNLAKIKEKAMLTGNYTEDRLEAMSPSEIARLIFSDGFSTADTANEHAGRGQGMNVIKDIVSKYKGKMKFSFAKGKYFELGVEFPRN